MKSSRRKSWRFSSQSMRATSATVIPTNINISTNLGKTPHLGPLFSVLCLSRLLVCLLCVLRNKLGGKLPRRTANDQPGVFLQQTPAARRKKSHHRGCERWILTLFQLSTSLIFECRGSRTVSRHVHDILAI